MCIIVFIQLSLGAVQSEVSQKPVTSKKNFNGCLENLLYNGHNLIELAKNKKQQVTISVSNFNLCNRI